jgi:hypothetical protein
MLKCFQRGPTSLQAAVKQGASFGLHLSASQHFGFLRRWLADGAKDPLSDRLTSHRRWRADKARSAVLTSLRNRRAEMLFFFAALLA